VLLWWAAGGRVRASPVIAAACVVAVGAAMALHPPDLPLSPYKTRKNSRLIDWRM
jgi:hypothetical protein